MKRSGFNPKPQKQCKNCGEWFVASRTTQKACGIKCAQELARETRLKHEAKAAAVARRKRKEELKTKAERLKEAQAAVNRYVRLRDWRLGCVSCDKGPDWRGQWHASHYRSVGAAPQLRFNLKNIHKACSVCNNYLSGNIMNYRPELINRIGEDRVTELECNQELSDYSDEYLKRLKRIFAKKCRILEKRRNEMLC